MINRSLERERPQRLADAYRGWIESTETFVKELHIAARWCASVFYSEPVFISVNLDGGTIDFLSRISGSVPNNELDVWLLTSATELPVIITHGGREVLFSFELPEAHALVRRLLNLGVPPEFGGAERVERALQRPSGR